jgi:hypothetical protein
VPDSRLIQRALEEDGHSLILAYDRRFGSPDRRAPASRTAQTHKSTAADAAPVALEMAAA